MNKVRRIAISIIIGMIAIFGIYSVSNAYYVGQSITVTYNRYASSSNIFCVEHGQALTADNSYEIISNVKIEGTKSTDYQNKTIENKSNAKFAYILSAENGSSHDSGPVQNEIWNYGYTWMKNVGQYHNGLNLNFVNANPGDNAKSTTDLDIEASNYADNISSGMHVTDNTDKSKITVQSYRKDETQYMRVGPFNWTFGGKLTDVSIYDQNSKPIAGKLYSTFSGKTEKWINVGEIKSGSDFYISIPVNSGATKITKVTGKMNVDVKAVNIWFLESTTSYKQNLIIREPYNATETIDLSFDYNISILGNLKVIKVNKDNTKVKLPNVGFKIQNKDTKKWVKEANETISYVDNKDEAKEFITDKNGEITIKNLIVGTYVAYETKNPNYGYEMITEGKEKDVIVDKTAELQIPNKQKYIKLSGYVWVDNVSGKQSTRNDLYKEGTYDSDDMLLDGITVRLKDTSGKVIKEAKTANEGAYQFIDVLVDDLDKYYIEFEYDGLTYTNVMSYIDKDNGSKAAENSTVREDFNKGFSSVVGGETSEKGATLDENGNKKNDLNYRLTYDLSDGAKSELINGNYPIKADTNETGYNIKSHFTYGQEEIKYINLGLYKREQPDISLVKDLYNVKLSINGYNHVYDYNQRFKESIDVPNDAGDGNDNNFNVGVRYKDKFKGSYNRAIYQSDYDYTVSGGKNKLEVYVTYQLRMNNESSSLKTRVNSIVDYYDDNYELYRVGNSIDSGTRDVEDNISHDTPEDLPGNYTKVKLNLPTDDESTKVEHGKYTDIYVQFKLKDQAVINIINNKENLNNIAEINSYSVFNTNGNIYAGIDRDSNPGSVSPENPADVTTHQDDTSSAPGLLLQVEGTRTMAGKVFLDESTGGIGVERKGDGEYKEGEKGISGVNVTLNETSGSGQTYTVTTDSNGDFYISGYIPGDYTLTYTWGDETYTVQDYKGTIYNDKDRATDKNWYKATEPRYSDALDNYKTREKIDAETKIITGTTTTKINKMDSITPLMGIGIEEETDGNTKFGTTSIETETDGDKFIPKGFSIKNIDFGIVERAKQQIDINKRVSGFKVTLANGQVVADVTIDKDGNPTGEKNHVTYGPASPTTIPSNGFVRLELDNELIQGATVQVSYEILIKNNSELDYNTQDYYLYGIRGEEKDIIGIKPEGVYDYLDSQMVLDNTKDNQAEGWSIVSKDNYSYSGETQTITDAWFNESTKKDADGKIVYTTESTTNSYKDIFTEWGEELTQERTIKDEKLNNRTILENKELEETELIPIKGNNRNNINSATLYASKVLTNTDEIDLNNDAEITEVSRSSKTGRKITPTSSTFYNRGETVIITPPTGQEQKYIAIIITTISSLVILGAGVVLIRKKILGNK